MQVLSLTSASNIALNEETGCPAGASSEPFGRACPQDSERGQPSHSVDCLDCVKAVRVGRTELANAVHSSFH